MGLWSQDVRVERLSVALLRGIGETRVALAMHYAWQIRKIVVVGY